MKSPEHIKPYAQTGEKGQQVEQMFDSIAPAYDFMNLAMTLGLHHWWRHRGLARLSKEFTETRSPERILDVACGTGDVSFSLAEIFPQASIEGIDLSAGMLEVARKRLASKPQQISSRISFREGDCLNLPYEDSRFDAVTVAYGVRNFSDLRSGVREMVRVLRPGGRLLVIELCEPVSPPLRLGYRFYSRRLIPFLGRMVSGDKSAYTYLPQSIAACPQRSEMTALLEECGLRSARFSTLFPGVIGIYIASK